MQAVVIGRNYSSLLGMIMAAGMAGCEIIAIRTVKDGKLNLKKTGQVKKTLLKLPVNI